MVTVNLIKKKSQLIAQTLQECIKLSVILDECLKLQSVQPGDRAVSRVKVLLSCSSLYIHYIYDCMLLVCIHSRMWNR